MTPLSWACGLFVLNLIVGVHVWLTVDKSLLGWEIDEALITWLSRNPLGSIGDVIGISLWPVLVWARRREWAAVESLT